MKQLALHALRHAYCLPWNLCSLIVMDVDTERPKEVVAGARWHHARSRASKLLLESHLEMSSFFTLSYLVSYLFLCGLFWNWGRDLKHKYPSGEVAETLRSGPLGLAVPPVHWRQQVAALLLWAKESHLWFEDLSVALLCSLALGEIANSSVVRSWFSSPGISHMFAHSFFPLCLLNGFLLSILTPT